MASVVVVTGGNSGIGKATAAYFAQKGYQVVITARRVDALNAVQQDLASKGGDILAVACDVKQALDVDHLVQKVMAHWGQIDVLIHSAGVAISGTILDSDEAQWDQILDTNLKGTYLVNRRILQEMVKQKSGSIVNVASDAGMLAGRNLAVYSASKGGVVLLSRAIALDFSHLGIRCNALCPGPVETPMTADLSAEEMDHWRKMLPLRRFATPEEIAEAAYYLAHATFATGTSLVVDGGNTAGGAI